MKTIIPVLVLVVVFAVFVIPSITQPGISEEAGELAPDNPLQINYPGQPYELRNGVLIQRLAKFEIEALVLHRKRYSWDKTAKLAPVDLALGWGPMSDGNVLQDINVSQSMRWYHWRTQGAKIPLQKISYCSANMHIIPANKYVRKQLLKVRRGHIVEITGYLVFVKSPDGWEWKSSLSRQDTGNHACEVIYAETLQYY